MNTRYYVCLPPALFLAMTVLCSTSTGDAAQNASGSKTKTDEWFCNVTSMGNFGTYCVYYAVHCDTLAPKSWSSKCDLKPGKCDAPAAPECAKLPTYADEKERARTERKGHVDADLKSNGIPNKKASDYRPILTQSQELSSHLVEFEDPGGNKLRARLYQVMKPRFGKYAPAIFSIGVEVESKPADKLDYEIQYDPRVVSFDGKVCYLDFGEVLYTIILHSQPNLRRIAPKKSETSLEDRSALFSRNGPRRVPPAAGHAQNRLTAFTDLIRRPRQ